MPVTWMCFFAATGAMREGWTIKTSGGSSMNIWRRWLDWPVGAAGFYFQAFSCRDCLWLTQLPLIVTETQLQDDEEDHDESTGGTGAEPGCDVIESGDVGVLFLEQLKSATEPNERTDFPNFRNLLWQSMVQFPERVEPRSRELSPLLLRFIRSGRNQPDGTLKQAFLSELCFWC